MFGERFSEIRKRAVTRRRAGRPAGPPTTEAEIATPSTSAAPTEKFSGFETQLAAAAARANKETYEDRIRREYLERKQAQAEQLITAAQEAATFAKQKDVPADTVLLDNSKPKVTGWSLISLDRTHTPMGVDRTGSWEGTSTYWRGGTIVSTDGVLYSYEGLADDRISPRIRISNQSERSSDRHRYILEAISVESLVNNTDAYDTIGELEQKLADFIVRLMSAEG